MAIWIQLFGNSPDTCLGNVCIMYIVIYYLGVFNSTYFSIKNSFCFFNWYKRTRQIILLRFFSSKDERERGRSFNTLNFNYYVCLVTNQKQFPFHVEFVLLFDLSVVDSIVLYVYTRSLNNTIVSICNILILSLALLIHNIVEEMQWKLLFLMKHF